MLAKQLKLKKREKEVFFKMALGTLSPSLLRNLLADKRTIRAGKETIRAGKAFYCHLIL